MPRHQVRHGAQVKLVTARNRTFSKVKKRHEAQGRLDTLLLPFDQTARSDVVTEG